MPSRDRETLDSAAAALVKLVPSLSEAGAVEGSRKVESLNSEEQKTRELLKELQRKLDYYFGEDAD